MTDRPNKCLVDQAKANPDCLDPDVEGLTTHQLATLHSLKAKILDKISKTYETVPQDRTDIILKKFMINAMREE
jgi:hypothetical protein